MCLRLSTITVLFFSFAAVFGQSIASAPSRQALRPSFFMANEVLPSGKQMHGNQEVKAVLHSNRGLVHYDAGGASFKVHSSAQGKLIEFRAGFSVDQAGKQSVQPMLKHPKAMKVNWLLGVQADWRTNVPVYETLAYENVWPGIDVEYSASDQGLAPRVVAKAGANFKSAVFETGADQLQLNAKGELIAKSNDATLHFGKPKAYQLIEGQKHHIDVRYRVLENGKFGYEFLTALNSKAGVIVSPSLVWSTYLGYRGGSGSQFEAMAIGADGSTYYVGSTNGVDIPLSEDGFQTSYAGGSSDALVLKMNSAGSEVAYATLLGGTGEDRVYDVVVDAAGQVVVYGTTTSADYPVTSGTHDETQNGGRDLFVTKLNSGGTALIFSTYVGGLRDENTEGIALDSNDDVVIAGFTNSNNFPTTVGSYASSYAASTNVSFVARLAALDGQLMHGTFFGGSTRTEASGLHVDNQDSIYICGTANDNNLPVTGAIHGPDDSGPRVFLAKFNSALDSLVWSTTLGGSDSDIVRDIEVDGSQQVYLVGETRSLDFPTTPGAMSTTSAQLIDIFVTKVAADGQSLEYSTFNNQYRVFPKAIVVDGQGRAIISGNTETEIPTFGNGYASPTQNTDRVFVTALNASGSAREFTAILSGENQDTVVDMAMDSSDNIFLLGFSRSSQLPVTQDAPYPSLAGSSDPFVSKLDASGSQLLYSTYLNRGNQAQTPFLVVDHNDQPIVAMSVASSFHPTTNGSYDLSFNGSRDIGVLKMDVNATQIEWATYIGGTGSESIQSIDLDDKGNLYILSSTSSTDFPTTAQTFANGLEADSGYALSKLSAAGDQLMFSSYLQGDSLQTEYVEIRHISGDEAYVAGHTSASDFPVTAGAFDTTLNDGDSSDYDVFLMKLNLAAGAVVFSTFLGGSDFEVFDSLAVDSNGLALVGGLSESSDYPVTEGAFDTVNADREGIITKVNSSGTGLEWSTFFAEEVFDLEFNASDQIYVTSPAKPGVLAMPVFYEVYPRSTPAIAKLSSDGSRLLNFNHFESITHGRHIQLNTAEQVVSLTSSRTSSLQTTDGTANVGMDDVFVAVMASDLSDFRFSTYFGGGFIDYVESFAVGSDDSIFVLGVTTSADFPTTADVYNDGSGAYDLFLSKLQVADCQGPTAMIVFNERIFDTPIRKCVGFPYQLKVEAGGTGPLAYQWYKDNQAIAEGTRSKLDLNGELSDSGSYHCEVISSCGTVVTEAHDVLFSYDFTLLRQPEDVTACSGAYVKLETKVIDDFIDFYWYKEDDNYFRWFNRSETYFEFLMRPEWDGTHFVQLRSSCGNVYTQAATVAWVPGTMTIDLMPGSQGPGLGLPSFDLGIGCPDMQHAISVNLIPETPYQLNNGIVTLTNPPAENVVVQISVDYGEFNPVAEATGLYLHTENTGLIDFNGDGCNSNADFLALAAAWRETVDNDGDGDLQITVLDFLYLPANSPDACP